MHISQINYQFWKNINHLERKLQILKIDNSTRILHYFYLLTYTKPIVYIFYILLTLCIWAQILWDILNFIWCVRNYYDLFKIISSGMFIQLSTIFFILNQKKHLFVYIKILFIIRNDWSFLITKNPEDYYLQGYINTWWAI